MSDEQVLCWREAVRVCMRRGAAVGLAQHLARLSEDDRAMLLAGIDSEELRTEVNCLLRRQQEQLALV
jgi:hypothetical protein